MNQYGLSFISDADLFEHVKKGKRGKKGKRTPINIQVNSIIIH